MAPHDSLNIRHDEVFDSIAFWKQHDADIIIAPRSTGTHFFYPVYQYGDAYSYSPFLLMRHKGRFVLNDKALLDVSDPRNEMSDPDLFIDAEITRLGGPPTLTTDTSDVSGYVIAMARGMQADIDDIEAQNPGYTNYILCGGRDSLNLLLAKWANPVVVLSAQPNFNLVEEFVARNGLGFEVIDLQDTRPSDADLDREVAEACTLTQLENWKWGPHLTALAKQADHKAIFWKGQFADAFLTDYWRSYTFRRNKLVRVAKKLWRRAARVLPSALSYLPDQLFFEDYRQSIWKRGSVGQGAHMGFIRSITGCLSLSGYHGPNASAVWLDADLRILAKQDLRPDIGEALFGGEVWYPAENPSPPISHFRQNQRSLARFELALKRFSVDVASRAT